MQARDVRTGFWRGAAPIGYVALLVAMALLASMATMAFSAEKAYAGGRMPSFTASKNTASELKGTMAMTLAAKGESAAIESLSVIPGAKWGAAARNPYSSKKTTVSAVKNSKKAVAAVNVGVSSYKWNGKYYMGATVTFTAKKVGKTKVSFTLKNGSKKKKCSFTVTVHAHDAMFSKLSVGGTNLTANANAKSYTQLNSTKLSGKFAVKLKKNWKLKSATFYTNSYPQKATTLKKGESYTLKGGYMYLMLRNAKDKRVRHVMISLKTSSTMSVASNEAASASAGSSLVAAAAGL